MDSDPLAPEPTPQIDNITTQIDSAITTPEQKKQLDDSFSTYFSEVDSKEAEQPEKPAREPKAERQPEQQPIEDREPASTQEPQGEVKPRKIKKSAKDAESIPDIGQDIGEKLAEEQVKTDLDSMEPHPASSSESRGHFKVLKEAAKEFRERAKVFAKLAPLAQEYGIDLHSDDLDQLSKNVADFAEKVKQARNPAVPQELTQELEHLRQLKRAVGVLDSESFTQQYVKPVDEAYVDVVEELSRWFDASPEKIKEEFTDPLLTKFKPSMLPPEWWDSQLSLATRAPESIKAKLQQKIANVLLLQEKHDLAARDLTVDPKNYATFQEKQKQEYEKAYASNVQDEVQKNIFSREEYKEIAALHKKALEGDEDAKKEFAPIEEQFRDALTKTVTGPRANAQLAAENVRLTREAAKSQARQKKIEELEAEIQRIKPEIAAKRRIKDAPFGNNGHGSGKAQAPKASLIKDPRKSLQSAFDNWKTD